MVLVPIPAGSFTMGQDGPVSDCQIIKHPGKFDDADWDEHPAHKVTISKPFLIGATEVTLCQYRQFKPEYAGGKGADNDAVTGVSWSDAVAFCEWLSKKEGKPYRLPTEAEWEYACRAGTATLFNLGDALPPGYHKWVSDLGSRDRLYPNGKLPTEFRSTSDKSDATRVGQTPANAWGVFDMHGNVAEWCADWYGSYEPGDQTDPLGRAEGDFRVTRGGSHSIPTRFLRSANRSAWLPESSSDRIGFRVVQAEAPKGSLLAAAPPPLNGQNVTQNSLENRNGSVSAPFFSGPDPYVKIPPGSAGPLFSFHNHSPSITECPNGDLLAVWYSCVDEGGGELCNVASRLRYGTKEWEPASPFWDGPDINDHAPKIWWDGEETIYHFAHGLGENIMRTSTDSGATWSGARRIQPPGEFGNRVLRLHDGTLVLGHDSSQVSLVFSHDEGKTWSFNDVAKRPCDFRPGGKGARYPGIHAPMVELSDGRIMALSRNDKTEDQEKFAFKTPASFTSDLGKTWTCEATEFPAISSVQRAAMIRLREGPILFCSFTDQWRDWKDRHGLVFKDATGREFTGYGLFAALSFDDGKTWPVRRLVTPGGKDRMVDGIDRLQFVLGDTMAEPCGYLALTQTRDGNIRLLSSKNHYAFNLPWLLEGSAYEKNK